jgi:hypothetical protein
LAGKNKTTKIHKQQAGCCGALPFLCANEQDMRNFQWQNNPENGFLLSFANSYLNAGI